MTSQYHYGIYSQNRAAERHILHSIMTLSQIQDGGRPLTWKSLSAYLVEKWSDYDRIWYSK